MTPTFIVEPVFIEGQDERLIEMRYYTYLQGEIQLKSIQEFN